MAATHRTKSMVTVVCAGLLTGAVLSPPALGAPGTAATTPAAAVDHVGLDLAAALESSEKQNWRVPATASTMRMNFSRAATRQWDTIQANLRARALDSRGLVHVAGVEVSIANSAVISSASSAAGSSAGSSAPSTTAVIYDVHFSRDVAELSAREDWEEVVPYTLELSPTGQVTAMTVQEVDGI
ncbi:hypothetical protein [Citricoccus sp. GCM10030269]|uniref:hypothetical protein n=1 Tax=Citricoccus sp. GCM10030269 TaxID=3273388 RepID=UPI0036196C5F